MFQRVSHNYEMRDPLKLKLPAYRTVNYGKNGFRYNGCILWNGLAGFRDVLTSNAFKNSIKHWNGPMCNCTYCDMCIVNNM